MCVSEQQDPALCVFAEQIGQSLYGVLCPDWIKWTEGGETWVIDQTLITMIIIIFSSSIISIIIIVII